MPCAAAPWIALPTPATDLLYVRAVDRAGNHSPTYPLALGDRIQLFLPVVTR